MSADFDRLIEDYVAWADSPARIPEGTTTVALLHAINQGSIANNNSTDSTSYNNPNYSGAISTANAPQNLATANVNRDRLTIQNLDEDEVLIVNIDADAAVGTSFVLDPGLPMLLEEGEADKRVSVSSSKAGLKFAAIGRVKQ